MRVVLFDVRTAGHHLQHVRLLADSLLESGDHVTFVTPVPEEDVATRLPSDPAFEIATVEEVNVSSPLRRLPDQVHALGECFRLAAEREADVLHVMDLNRIEIPLLLAARRHRDVLTEFKLVGTVVAPYFLSRDAGPVRTLCYCLNRWCLESLLNDDLLAALFVLSERTRDLLGQRWPELSDRIIAVPDPIEPPETKRDRTQSRQLLDLPADAPLILFFGRTRREKGAGVLLSGLESVDIECVCLFAGPPGAVDETDIACAQDRVPEHVSIVDRLTFVPDDEVSDYFRSASLVVLPYREGYAGTSGVLQHSAAAGRPVVASDAPELGDIVRTWGLGVTVPPEDPDALARAINDCLSGDMLETTAEKGAGLYVEHHHWRRWGSAVREIYSDLRMS